MDLIYLDPPFNSNRDYEAPIGSVAAGAAFKDTWTLSDLDVAWMGLIADEHPAIYQTLVAAGLTHGKSMQSYLCMMAVRLLEMRRVLKNTGSVYLHCDTTASHYLKLTLDATFGEGHFGNEIIWQRSNPKGLASTRFARNHDVILRVTKSVSAVWNPMYAEHPSDSVKKQYNRRDADGRLYQLTSLT
ncbi:MAG: site-specific DNA-methyltransferase, partial [Chloroflexi bacterium]|nr:site-specific DNA-methyltransferase [Chloroflexota bacterium]